MKYLSYLVVLFIISTVAFAETEEASDPPQVSIGERLFLETRFAQAYAAHPDRADPALAYSLTTGKPLRGPFVGRTMNCRACHLVDEHQSDPGAGMRTYADFARHSPIPDRHDGRHVTARNTMSMVGITPPDRRDVVFHFDGEFNSMPDLVRGTLTGRNFGWLPDEYAQAIRHIARVIRGDDGRGELAREYGGSYRKILTGTARDIPASLRLPRVYRVDVATASDKEIVAAVSKLIAAYVDSLQFSRDAQGNYNGSPYDQFLKHNHLPRRPRAGESGQAYAQRLLQAVERIKAAKFLHGKQHHFIHHRQAFVFGRQELRGMKLFFTRGSDKTRGGNCVSCHTPPDFSDFGFHNTGVSQLDYDAQHGSGAFARLAIPDLAMRNRHYDRYLPATPRHPRASGRFQHRVEKDRPGFTDLGLWNVFASPDLPAAQAKLLRILCRQRPQLPCNATALLPDTIAAFKTPVLRDLGDSNPYMHTGQFDTLAQAVRFYVTTSVLVKQGRVRNADRELHAINLREQDVAALAAFLRSLNEDYE